MSGPKASHGKPLGPVAVSRELIASPAFLALRGHAPQVLLIFYTKRQMAQLHIGKKKGPWTCVNNGHIVFPYREARDKYHLGFSTFKRALGELTAKGFLRTTPVVNAEDWDEPAMYELTDDWKTYIPPQRTAPEHTVFFSEGHPLY